MWYHKAALMPKRARKEAPGSFDGCMEDSMNLDSQITCAEQELLGKKDLDRALNALPGADPFSQAVLAEKLHIRRRLGEPKRGLRILDIRELPPESEEGFSEAVYEAIFGRAMDRTWRKIYADLLKSAGSRERFFVALGNTEPVQAEGVFFTGFTRLYPADFLCHRGDAFLEALYAYVLGRTPDVKGFYKNREALRNGSVTPEELIYGMVHSAEAKDTAPAVPELDALIRKIALRKKLGTLPVLGGAVRAYEKSLAKKEAKKREADALADELKKESELLQRLRFRQADLWWMQEKAAAAGMPAAGTAGEESEDPFRNKSGAWKALQPEGGRIQTMLEKPPVNVVCYFDAGLSGEQRLDDLLSLFACCYERPVTLWNVGAGSGAPGTRDRAVDTFRIQKIFEGRPSKEEELELLLGADLILDYRERSVSPDVGQTLHLPVLRPGVPAGEGEIPAEDTLESIAASVIVLAEHAYTALGEVAD
ncbi:MAG: DUF4214 domain-containing protein [Lachnospiraceae bacterium]|nr:DUF4214 domain-containing protein [Lachnospiraceae bacterium]